MEQFEYFIYNDNGIVGQIKEPDLSNLKVKRFRPRRYDHTHSLIVDDERDIKEIAKRKRLKTFHPIFEELYTYNPDFDGNYTW